MLLFEKWWQVGEKGGKEGIWIGNKFMNLNNRIELIIGVQPKPEQKKWVQIYYHQSNKQNTVPNKIDACWPSWENKFKSASPSISKTQAQCSRNRQSMSFL